MPTASLALAVFLMGQFLFCAGCATAPGGGVPGDGSAPRIKFPSSTRVLGKATVYVSAAGERVEVVHDATTGAAIIKLTDDSVVVLPAEIAGSEGLYRDSRMTVWEKDGGVLIWVEGKLAFSGTVAN